jgi:hypothetical protein
MQYCAREVDMGAYPREHITAYLRCSQCDDDIFRRSSSTIVPSPREYGRMECGFTRDGFQVWCLRHDINIIHIDFDGEDVTVDITRRGSFSYEGATTMSVLKQQLA